METILDDTENPWMYNSETTSEIDTFVKNYRKYWDEQNSKLRTQKLDLNNKNETEIKQLKILVGDLNDFSTLEGIRDKSLKCLIETTKFIINFFSLHTKIVFVT